MAEFIDIVLSPRDDCPDEMFVDIEDTTGHSIKIGVSKDFYDEQGFRRIRITPQDITKA